MLAFARLAQFVVCAAANNIGPMLNEVLDHLNQAQFFGLAVDNGEVDDAETGLELRVLVQAVENDLRLLAALQFVNNTQAVTVAFVANFRDAFNAFFVDQGRRVFNQARFVDLIRNLRDNDVLTVFGHALNGGLGADFQGAAPAGVGIHNALPAQNIAASGEIWSLHDLQDFRQPGFRMADQQNCRLDDLRQVVRRNIGRHAHCDAGGAVDQQVGHAGGENFRFVFALVVIGAEVDGFLVDIFQQSRGNLRKTRFGVPHGRRRITVHRSEVALPIHQRIAHAEGLRHTDQGVVDRRIAVRVVFAEDFADNLGALTGGPVGRQTHFVHAVKNAAMDWFETVANIGQRASHNHAHSVIEVRAFHLIFDVDGFAHSRIGRIQPGKSGWWGRRGWTLRGIILISHVFGLNPILPDSCGLAAENKRPIPGNGEPASIGGFVEACRGGDECVRLPFGARPLRI